MKEDNNKNYIYLFIFIFMYLYIIYLSFHQLRPDMPVLSLHRCQIFLLYFLCLYHHPQLPKNTIMHYTLLI